jgi:hypothetical protein
MSLYAFTTHTFTNAGKTGSSGPSIDEVRTAYSSETWAQNVNYLFMTSAVGIQRWKVPATGTYKITAAGAQGGTSHTAGGKGAKMSGTFSLTQGDGISILVGQEGGVSSSSTGTGCNAGGGGGSFVWMTGDSSLLIAAGGGGGSGGNDGTTATDGTGAFGTSTAGTKGNGATPGGSGWLSNGTSGLDGNNAGCKSPLNGGAGGIALSSTTVGNGGFGGGASASGQPCGNGGPGGGGGYSGGAGPSGDTTTGTAGGGGSYNSGTNKTDVSGANTGHGYVTITRSQITATLTAPTTTFYRKFISGASISLDVSSNAGAVPRTHVSNNTSIVTIPTAATPSATIVGPGKTTIKVTQPATTTYTEVVNNALITIVVMGQGTTYTSETFPASFDMSGTNLSNSTFTDCTFTSTNLFGITVDASTNFSASTFTGVGSGRITGKTSLLPVGFTMI